MARLAVIGALVGSLALPPPSRVHAQPDGCPDIVIAYFGERSPQACRIALCESRWDFNAVSPDGRNIGLFQINVVHGWHASFDPDTNVAYAYQLSRGGWYWRDWSCRP